MKKNVLHKYSIHPCWPPHTSFCRDAIVSVDIISVIRLSNESRHVAKEQFFINFCPKKQTRALDEKRTIITSVQPPTTTPTLTRFRKSLLIPKGNACFILLPPNNMQFAVWRPRDISEFDKVRQQLLIILLLVSGCVANVFMIDDAHNLLWYMPIVNVAVTSSMDTYPSIDANVPINTIDYNCETDTYSNKPRTINMVILSKPLSMISTGRLITSNMDMESNRFLKWNKENK